MFYSPDHRRDEDPHEGHPSAGDEMAEECPGCGAPLACGASLCGACGADWRREHEPGERYALAYGRLSERVRGVLAILRRDGANASAANLYRLLGQGLFAAERELGR